MATLRERERERDRERQRERDRDRERDRERQRHRDTERERDRERHRAIALALLRTRYNSQCVCRDHSDDLFPQTALLFLFSVLFILNSRCVVGVSLSMGRGSRHDLGRRVGAAQAASRAASVVRAAAWELPVHQHGNWLFVLVRIR